MMRRIAQSSRLTYYWLALILLSLAPAPLLRPQTPSMGAPEALPGSAARRLILQIPEYTSFDYSGLAFFDGKLYATTNIGLLEIDRGRITKVHRVQRQYSVVSGPWLDAANKLLWLVDDQTHEFLNFDGASWRRVPMPWPEKVYYSRGEVLEGVKAVGNRHGFWIVAAGNVWRWERASGHWHSEPSPQMTPATDIIGVLPVGEKLLFLVRHQRWGRLLVRPGAEFKSDSIAALEGSWQEIPNSSGSFLAEQWVVSGDAAYIRSDTGMLLRVTPNGIASLNAPGECESLATSSRGTLLASIRGKGIYEYAGQWKLRASIPHASGSGDYWSYLAENNGDLAYAVTAKPVMDKKHSEGMKPRWIRNAPTALWVAGAGAEFQEVRP